MREPDQQFQDFVATRGPALLRTALLLTGNQEASEDLVQSALEKALRHWSRIKVPAATEGYVRQIMYRQNVSVWRQHRDREIPVAEIPEPRAADSSAAVDNWLVMRQALRRLAPRQRTVLVLRYYEDLTEEQVARAMGVSVGTVKATAQPGRARLALTLAGTSFTQAPPAYVLPLAGDHAVRLRTLQAVEAGRLQRLSRTGDSSCSSATRSR